MFHSFAGPLARASIDDRLRKARSMHPAATAHTVRLQLEGRLPGPAPKRQRSLLRRGRLRLSNALIRLAGRIEPTPVRRTRPMRAQ
jgi:hypothetical protein